MTIIFAILLFSLLIFVHELGHFLAAKASGVKVNEFSMFMGPVIWKKQGKETLYSLRCIPIGGFCAMEGEDEDTDNPRSFQKAAWWKRLIILVAGAAMNFIVGFILFAVIFMPQDEISVPVISYFEAGSAVCGEGGLQVGDEILEVDGEKVYVANDVSMLLYLNESNETHDLVVRRNGETVELNDFRMEKRTFNNEESPRYGFTFKEIEPTFWQRLGFTWDNTIDNIRNVRLSLQMLFTGKAGLKDMSGPVGIVDTMSTVANASPTATAALMNMLMFGAIIAVNLAVMNLLPLPALDGGRVFCLLVTTVIQKITKKKINPKYEGYIHAVGMILLLVLMAVIMFKDIFVIFRR
ncbi:MAG: site-2 protease family protein [Ruminococcaceae bacterium]|nr:site-2 protease family protein [Oscillospiraceae bacterium]MBQ3215288.1 site-2 protease family protein [Oscillospiraceae bacterium]